MKSLLNLLNKDSILQVRETKQFELNKRKLKNQPDLLLKIDETIELFITDMNAPSLHFKKIKCKKDLNRYSVRVLNTQYRILMTLFDDYADLFCICKHDIYDRYNKGC